MRFEEEGSAKYFYSAYGLNIGCDFQLPELTPAKFGADVTIRLGTLEPSFLDAEMKDAVVSAKAGLTVRARPGGICAQWLGIATMLIRDGCEVIVQPDPGVSETELSPYINGSILAVLLHQRGLMVLHASAVNIDGQAVAFVGQKGAGKSTFAAHFQNRGHNLLTDDLVPIKFDADGAFAIPGFPRIRLWSDSVISIGVDPQTLPRINSFVNKLSYKCQDSFSPEAVKLSRIYVLTENPSISIEKLDRQEAFIEVARNCYLSRYMQSTGQTAAHFRHCEALVSSTPVYKLKRPHNFSLLSEVSSIIENHF